MAAAAELLKAEHPTHADPYFELAGAYRRSGNVVEAITWYRQAITHDAGYLEPILALGTLLSDAGQQADASAMLQKAAELRAGRRQNLDCTWQQQSKRD